MFGLLALIVAKKGGCGIQSVVETSGVILVPPVRQKTGRQEREVIYGKVAEQFTGQVM